MTTRTSASYRLTLTVGLCFLVALMEGLDLQAAGIAAVGIAQAFALDKMQMGWIFSAGILGLLPGALVGGMLADRYGRKRILIASVALFGLFSLATAISWDFSSLVFARLMTGVGLGAALPNLIALTSEAAGPRFRGTAVSLMYCGVPNLPSSPRPMTSTRGAATPGRSCSRAVLPVLPSTSPRSTSAFSLPPLAVSMAAAAGVRLPSAKAPTTTQSTAAVAGAVWFRLN